MILDDIISELGEFGPYQKKLFYLVCLAAIPGAFHSFVVVFSMATQNHRCAIPGLPNDTYKSQGSWHNDVIKEWVPWNKNENKYSSCKLYDGNNATNIIQNRTRECSAYVYDNSTFETTFVSHANIVCEEKSLTTYATMIFMTGMLVGSIILGPLADIIGRKKVLLMSVTCTFGVTIGISFVNSYGAFVLLRFFTAFFCIGQFLTAFVIGIEMVGPSKRKLAGIVFQFCYSTGLLILALFAYFIRDWRHLHFAIAVPGVVLFSYAFLLPESPRWLISRQRLDEALTVLEKVAKGNNVVLSEKSKCLENIENEGADEKIWQMLKHKALLVRSGIIFYIWFVSSMVYFGLSLNVGHLSGNIRVNYLLSSLVEGGSYLLCFLLLDRLGRKPLQCFTMLLAGFACLSTVLPVMYGGDGLKWITVVLSLVGKFGISAALGTIHIYSAELFPTAMRNSGMGVCYFSSRLGGIIAPYISDLSDLVKLNVGVALPLVIFGGASVAAGVLALSLPETTNKILPDSIQDAKVFGRKPRKNEYALDHLPSDHLEKDNLAFKF